MREGAENANVELGAMLAVVVLLAVIRVVGALGPDDSPTARAAEVTVAELAPVAPIPAAPIPAAPIPVEAVPAETDPDAPAPAESEAANTAAPVAEPAPEEEPEEPTDAPRPRPAPPRLSAALLPELAAPDEAAIADEIAQHTEALTPQTAVVEPPPPAPRATPAPAEAAPEPEVFQTVAQMPELIGGLASVQRRIRYPDLARRMGVEGRVFVQFVVNEDGSVADVRTVRGIGAGCDEAAEAAVRAARFTPGRQRGRPVKVRMTLPVTFRAD